MENIDAENYVSCGETVRLIFQTIPPLSLSLSLFLKEYQISRNDLSSEIRVGDRMEIKDDGDNGESGELFY